MGLRIFSVLLFFVALAWPVISEQLAFPGAEGFGRHATGGRDGSVYVVTNLDDSGKGSLRDALSESDRIIVFAVGGTINITDRMVVSKRVSILGQTAPGDGIATYGSGWSFSNANDAIGWRQGQRRHHHCRRKNMIFDHISVSWGRDETSSINGESEGGVSLFRNLYIDNKMRNPKVKGVNDFTNNVVYNWGSGGGYIAGGSDGKSYVNVMGNYFISGPSTSKTAFTRGNDNFYAYVGGNFYDSDKDGELNGSELGVASSNYGGMYLVDTKYDYPAPSTVMNTTAAVDYVANYAGASLVRDSVDAYLVSELKSWGKEGDLISDETASPVNGPGYLNPGTKRTDTDGDGISDEAEENLGTDSSTDDSMKDTDGNGYKNVEDWANSLVPSSY
ncbi:pectin lyase fold/virulence factor [Phyllosticta citriasiana]|uniref:pectin lyase fold/virulence factor n=1 Tax=Phyllosticta citriasiana TaxID=595635 RepID=UPI0030FD58BB